MRVLLLIGICIVVGLVVFGENPLREFQRQQRELMAKYGTDDLSVATNIYVEQQQNSGGGFMGLLSGNQPTEPPSESNMISSIKTSADSATNSAIKSAMHDAANPLVAKVAKPDIDLPEDNFIAVEVSTGLNSNSNGEKKPEKPSNYYPPIVGQASVEPENQQKPMVLTGKEPKLRSGQIIAYEGTSVYLVDKMGNRTNIPDGEYILQDGSQMIIVNGQSMLK